MPDIDLKQMLLQSKLGFFEVPMLDPRAPPTSFTIRGKQLRVVVLVPERGNAAQPIFLPALKTYATAVRFLDYLLEDTEPVALLTPAGVLAHVPAPARYAVHKLVTSQRRLASESAKAKKDRRQADFCWPSGAAKGPPTCVPPSLPAHGLAKNSIAIIVVQHLVQLMG